MTLSEALTHITRANEARAAFPRECDGDLSTALVVAEGVMRERLTSISGSNHKLDNDRQVFFYEQDFYVLSNFSSFRIRWCGKDFDTSEHAYHWTKFNGEESHHSEIQREIMTTRSAHDAFKLAEKYKASRRVDWDGMRVSVMASILRAKVEQHEYVRRKLLSTGDRELIEDSWRDDFWGWGPNRDGQNMLGKLWMEIRAELRSPASGPSEAIPSRSQDDCACGGGDLSGHDSLCPYASADRPQDQGETRREVGAADLARHLRAIGLEDEDAATVSYINETQRQVFEAEARALLRSFHITPRS